MYQDTITVFNRKSGDTGDTWYPTVLHNVDLNTDKSYVLSKYGTDSKDTASLHVRYELQPKGERLVGTKQWLPPKMWKVCEDPANAITFAGGAQFDFFWLGDWGSSDPIMDTDYQAHGDFYTYMNRTHDFVFAISSVDGPFSLIPHFEITGK